MIHRLNQHFINKVREATYAKTHAAVSSVPNYPTCIAYLNPAARKRHELIRQRLQRVWRGAVSDICFYQADFQTNSLAHPDGSPCNYLGELQKMFSQNTKFYDRSRLHLYCVLDTSDLTDLQTLANCINMACQLKYAAKIQNITVFLVFLLDESLQNLEMASTIRNWVRGYSKALGQQIDSICMISNRCGNNTTLDEYETSVVASSAILLTNTHNETKQVRQQTIGTLPMFTISYVGQQKPIEEISWVVLKTFAEQICEMTKEEYTDTGRLAQLLQLGIDGCFNVTRQQEQQLMSSLPTLNELEHFAKTEASDTPVSEMSYAEFNRLTFGGFADYLESRLTLDHEMIEQLSADYRKLLSEKIPVGVLAGISESAVEALIFDRNRTAPGYQNVSVGDAIRDIVRRGITDVVKKPFYDIVCGLIAKAKKQVEYFKNLQSALISDYGFIHFAPNVLQHYSGITRQYVETLRATQKQQFSVFMSVDTTEQQVELQLNKMIDDIISSYPIFSAALDDEMKQRIGNADSSTVATALQNKLLGHNTAENACWNTPYAMAASYQGIMMNTNSGESENMLYEILKVMFQKQKIDYFNSGSSDAVESVAVFPMAEQHLYSGNAAESAERN